MIRFRAAFLAAAACCAVASSANANSDATPYRVPTSDPNIDQVCFYLPGSTTPVCDRQVNKTSGVVTALPSLITGVAASLGATAINGSFSANGGVGYYNGLTQLDGQPNNLLGSLNFLADRPTSPVGLARGTAWTSSNNLCVAP